MKTDEIILDELLDEIELKMSSRSIERSPINEQVEKKKFFESQTYNPIFEYTQSKLDVKNLFSQAEKIKVKGDIGKALTEKLRHLEKRKNMFNAIGTDIFFQKSNLVYGQPDIQLISQAKKIINIKPISENEVIKVEEAVAFTRNALKVLGLNEWLVDEKDIGAKVTIIGNQKKIMIKKHCIIHKDFLKRILAHEIGTHVYRTENGNLQKYKIFKNGFANYLKTEEGLAVNIEEMHGCLDQNVLRNYAGRVLAVEFARKNSFRKTFEYLTQYFSNEDAWQLCVRVKRGITNAEKSGSYSRDHIYLKGYFEVKKYLSKSRNKLETLFLGKIGLEHVRIVSRMKGLQKPLYLPTSKEFTEFIKNSSV